MAQRKKHIISIWSTYQMCEIKLTSSARHEMNGGFSVIDIYQSNVRGKFALFETNPKPLNSSIQACIWDKTRNTSNSFIDIFLKPV